MHELRKCTWSVDTRSPAPSTGTRAPTRAPVSAGVATTAAIVLIAVIATLRGTSACARYETKFDATPPGQHDTRQILTATTFVIQNDGERGEKRPRCVCVCERETHTHTHTHTERERERETEREKEEGRWASVGHTMDATPPAQQNTRQNRT